MSNRLEQLEADRAKSKEDDTIGKQTRLESCVAEANAVFEKNIASNGTRQRDGSYNVPVPAAEQMQKLKQSKIEECKLLYSK